jgi:hypothetical protein
MQALPVELRTLLIVESAQGMIENGGLSFFYEADFPNNPPYSDFVEAYRRIGADAAAACIEQTALMFPFAEPHLFEPLRQLWLEKLSADPQGEFCMLSDRLSGDTSVWSKLADYVERNRAAFAG